MSPETVVTPRPSAATPPSALAQLLAFAAFCALLMFGPLALGGDRPWSLLVLRAGATALLLLWAAVQAARGALDINFSPLYAPVLLFAGLVGIQLLLGRTASWENTFGAALTYIAYAILVFLATQWLTPEWLARFAVTFSLYGFAVALFAILQEMTSNHRIYWVLVPQQPGWIFGPYLNHNHYAGLMEMLVPLPLALALNHALPGAKRFLLGFLALVMAASVFLSQSRGGVAALLLELAALYVLTSRRHRRHAAQIAIFAAALFAFLLWFGSGSVWTRLASVPRGEHIEIGMRLSVLRDGLRMARVRPLLGWGLGCFKTAYPQFRSFYTNQLVDYAHNDYLQALLETGLLGLAAVIWFVWVALSRGLRSFANWQYDASSAARLGVLLGVTGILLHSLVDFNLEIPGNTALFLVYCAVLARPRFAGEIG